MELRRRRGGDEAVPLLAEDENTQVVRRGPSDIRSQWTTYGSIRQESSISAYSNVSAYGGMLIDMTLNLLKQALSWFQYLNWASWGSATPVELDARARELLAEFKRTTSTPYDPKNAEHEKQLLFLWACSFPQESLEERVSDQWKRLGFQGTDPATDFRGCGIFGLRQLIYFAKRYPSAFQTQLRGEQHAEHYPFAITALNITNMLFEILGYGLKPTTSSVKVKVVQFLFEDNLEAERRLREEATSSYMYRKEKERDHKEYYEGESEQLNTEEKEDEEEVEEDPSHQRFGELFCASFYLFDLEWAAHKATYFDFPKVIGVTRTKVEKLVDSLNSFEDLLEHNARNLQS
jgi:hypothetical protein